MEITKPNVPMAGQPSGNQSSGKVQPLGKAYADAMDFAGLLQPGQRLIGLDLGTKTIGLALSDVTRTIATPLETIKRVKFTPDVQRLLAIAAEHKVGGFVLGLPVNMIGDEGPRAQATRGFARSLNAISPLPILFWDERLSSAAAERTLLEADTSRKRRAEVIDKMAAGIILQGAMDRMRYLVRTAEAANSETKSD
jgi:putative holliday junction resolvase